MTGASDGYYVDMPKISRAAACHLLSTSQLAALSEGVRTAIGHVVESEACGDLIAVGAVSLSKDGTLKTSFCGSPPTFMLSALAFLRLAREGAPEPIQRYFDDMIISLAENVSSILMEAAVLAAAAPKAVHH